MTGDAGLVEYLYIDEKRLDDYFQQISSPIAYPKVVRWVVALNPLGPRVEGTQERPPRPFTTHEKVTRFHKYLEKKKLAIHHRPKQPFEEHRLHAPTGKTGLFSWRRSSDPGHFRVECMTAHRGQVGPNNNADRRGLNLWVSEKPDGRSEENDQPIGALFLIENLVGEKERPLTLSGYSSLLLLTQELEPFLANIEADIFQAAAKMEGKFGRDPIGTLSALGARFGPSRRIQATYRVRACCYEAGQDGDTAPSGATTTIGYPIVIQAL